VIGTLLHHLEHLRCAWYASTQSGVYKTHLEHISAVPGISDAYDPLLHHLEHSNVFSMLLRCLECTRRGLNYISAVSGVSYVYGPLLCHSDMFGTLPCHLECLRRQRLAHLSAIWDVSDALSTLPRHVGASYMFGMPPSHHAVWSSWY
jgi:hypothetical protein